MFINLSNYPMSRYSDVHMGGGEMERKRPRDPESWTILLKVTQPLSSRARLRTQALALSICAQELLQLTWSHSISILWHLVRQAEPQAPLQHSGIWMCILMLSPGDSNAPSGLSSTALNHSVLWIPQPWELHNGGNKWAYKHLQLICYVETSCLSEI